MNFTKMHGLGNDYIYFYGDVEKPEELAVRLSDRHFGVGGDGIVLILPSDKADFRMRMFNADGSEGKMCGNATRCIGKYVYDKGLTDKTEITLETLSGIKHLKLTVTDGKVSLVSVNMGKPILTPAQIPVKMDGENIIDRNITVRGKEYGITCVSMGNPHCVVFSDTDPADINLPEIGPIFENLPIFPDRINTEFVKVLSQNTLKMRVWERGSGETLACGTGACAVGVSAVLRGAAKRGEDITVKLIGGDLIINYADDGTVWMTGPAEFVFEGTI